ncbi:hemolysin family protein [bacterium]|nr:hemolysin family protein [bacterium]
MESEPPSQLSRLLMLAVVCAAVLAAASASPPPGSTEAIATNSTGAWIPLVLAVVCAALAALFTMVQSALTGLSREARDKLSQTIVWRWLSPAAGQESSFIDRLYTRSSLFFHLATLVLAIDGFSRLSFLTPLAGGLLGGIISSALFFLVVDVALRNVALRDSERILRFLSLPAFAFSLPMRPLVRALSVLALPHRLRSVDSKPIVDREFRLLPHVTGVDRVVEEEAVDMIDSVRKFTESTVADVMTPRTDLEGVQIGTSSEEIYRILRATSYSRIVVYGENLDDIKGVLLAKEVLLNRPENPLDLLRDPIVTSENTHLPELLRRLRQTRSRIALVIDEYGGTAGIATLHDLFEALIGEHIEDEEQEDELWIEFLDADHARISGRVELWEINEELDLELDESVSRTLGGYLMHRFGRLPEVGESWTVNRGHFQIREIVNNRVSELLFERDLPARELLDVTEVEP